MASPRGLLQLCQEGPPQPCQAPGGGSSESPLQEPGTAVPPSPWGGEGALLGVGSRHPWEMGLGEVSPCSRAVRTQAPPRLLGRAPRSSLPTWKVVPRRVVEGLPRAGPGEGVPSLPLEGPGGPSGSEATLPQEASCRGYTRKAHALCIPTGGHMGTVCRSLPQLPTVRQRQSLRPGGLPGSAAPAVPSLSLRRVSGPGAPWEGPRKPLPASPATGPRPSD